MAAPLSDAEARDEAEVTALLLAQVDRFLSREVRSDAIDREGEIPKPTRDAAARLGLFGLTLPAEYGGAGLALASACRVVARIAEADRSVAVMLGLHAGLGTRGLATLGTAAARARWLPSLASGERIASFAATEAGAGSDLVGVRTTATPVPGGLRVDGEKSYVTNGRWAGLFTVLARSPGVGGERGHVLVCIPGDARGIGIGREEHKLGIRGSSTVTVRFDGVFVPHDAVLGTPGSGLEHTHDLLTWGRTLMSAGCLGTARAALAAAVQHATTRRQFGRTIGSYAATRAHLAWMAARVHAIEALVLEVAEAEGRGEPIEAPSAAAKVFSSEGAFEVCDRAVQLHGALGFLEETGVARMLRDCRITRIFEGANDVLLVRLGAARIASREADGPPRAVSPRVDALAARLARETAGVRARFGVAAIARQLVLQRLARADVLHRAAAAVAARAAEGDALAAYAEETLVAEAERALDDVWRGEADERRAHAVSELLYRA